MRGIELFTAALKSKLFSVNTLATGTAVAMAADGHASISVNPHMKALWHRRMGHVSEHLLQSMISQGAVICKDNGAQCRT